jgi:hypothetical protein
LSEFFNLISRWKKLYWCPRNKKVVFRIVVYRLGEEKVAETVGNSIGLLFMKLCVY